MEKLKNIENYRILKEKFVAYWTSDNLNRVEGTATDKAFLVYVKGFVDGINYLNELDEQLRKNK